MRRYGYLFLLGCFLLSNCNTSPFSKDETKDGSLPPKDNFIVLLDVGDRVLYNNEQQVPKDIEIIKSIYSIFEAKLTTKDTSRHYYSLRDRFKLLSPPNWVYANADLGAEKPENKASVAGKMQETLNFILPDIYKGIITGTTRTTHSGAAIWNYFDEHLSADLDKTGQNTLFILTDGYMGLNKTNGQPAQKNRYASCAQIINALKDYPDWEDQFTKGDYGLLPISKKMPANLQVVVLQVNPKQGWPGEDSLLTKIWDKWFTEMGISKYTLIKDDSTHRVKATLAGLLHAAIDTSAAPEQWTQLSASDGSFDMATVPDKTTDSGKTTAGTDSKTAMPDDAVKKEVPLTTKAPAFNPASLTPAGTEKKTPDAGSRRKSDADVLPPDESDAVLLNPRKTDKPQAKKSGTKNEDDILQDDAAANGFNTGIKKDAKKKKQ